MTIAVEVEHEAHRRRRRRPRGASADEDADAGEQRAADHDLRDAEAEDVARGGSTAVTARISRPMMKRSMHDAELGDAAGSASGR